MNFLRIIRLMGLFTLIAWPGLATGEPYHVKTGFEAVQLAGKFQYVQGVEPLVITHLDNTHLKPLRPTPLAIPIFPDRAYWYSVCFGLVNESPTPISAYLYIDDPVIDSLQVTSCDGSDCQSFLMNLYSPQSGKR